jgi:hypothetical protein
VKYVYTRAMHPASFNRSTVEEWKSVHAPVNRVVRDWSNKGLTNWHWIGHSVGNRLNKASGPSGFTQPAGLAMFVGIDTSGSNCRSRLMNIVTKHAVRVLAGRNHILMG